MNIQSFVQEVLNQTKTVEEHTRAILDEAVLIDGEYHYFNAFSGTLAFEQAKKIAEKIRSGKQQETNLSLAGVAVSVKDNMCVKDVETTAGSRILKGYKPLFNATAVQKLIDAGAIIIGKTAQDEFGFGSFSTNVGLGFETPLNPFDKTRSCGGSSGGAAGWTQKTKHCHAALAESTGGSIVNPASFCGVVGVCPTYGRVSRHGLLDYANSLDKIGVITKTVHDAALVLQTIAGTDVRDSTSSDELVPDYSSSMTGEIKGLRVGVLQQGFTDDIDSEVKKSCYAAVKRFEADGATLVDVELPLTMKYGLSAYYILAMTEASTNLAKFCGMRYGVHDVLKGSYDEYFSNVRSKNFGAEAKRRVLLGTFARMAGFRDKYYIKAAQVRTLIVQEYLKTFKEVDVLVSPTMPFIAPRFKEIEKLTPVQNYLADILTVGPNLAGLPHMSIPCGTSQQMPIGLLMTTKHFAEQTLFRIGGTYA